MAKSSRKSKKPKALGPNSSCTYFWDGKDWILMTSVNCTSCPPTNPPGLTPGFFIGDCRTIPCPTIAARSAPDAPRAVLFLLEAPNPSDKHRWFENTPLGWKVYLENFPSSVGPKVPPVKRQFRGQLAVIKFDSTTGKPTIIADGILFRRT